MIQSGFNVRWITCSLVALLLVCCATAQENHIAAINFYEVAISPDGSHVAWVQPPINQKGEALDGSEIYSESLNSTKTKPHRISAVSGDVDENSIAWSPDGKQIAFLSDADALGQAQLYVSDRDGGAAHKLTSLTGYLSHPAWSPDGKNIAFLFTENSPRAGGPLMPMTPETGVIESKVYEQRLAIVNLASGTVRQLSPPDMYVYEYDWSPDGKRFALTAARGEGDSNWYVAGLYTLEVGSQTMKLVYKPQLQIADPRWSPDGQNIAFISGLMSDEGVTGGDIFVVQAARGNAKVVTRGIAASPSSLHWKSAGDIDFAESIDSDAGFAEADIANDRVSQIWHGPETVATRYFGEFAASWARDSQKTAVIRDSSAHPPEIWAGPIGDWKQVTHINDSVHPDWGEIKSLHWKDEGIKIQGWLLYPKDYDPAQRYPMVVVPHGGPAYDSHSSWPGAFFNTHELSAYGYFVLYPNPRGSFGQGEAFTRANVKGFGYGDFRDIMAGVDEVVKTLPVDNDRIGITGWSYGGYMTMWAVTQTHRFHAAVAGAGLSDFLSYYGENDIDEWMIPYFGASVYEDPAIYSRSSPITFIKNVRTPTLILVGERDGECPAPQSREFWHALKTLGVPTQLVIYPGEGHAFLQTDHQSDVMERMLGWFDKYLKTAQTASGLAH
jgi:dipeptidyl aminopeptidase/acylaminoacyl peptidase